jgi:hypothetical protein
MTTKIVINQKIKPVIKLYMSNEIKEETVVVPKRIFIVPYRNRIQHKFFFSKYMSFLLEDKQDYEIYFSHQCDARTFNRGAIKNIGFIAAKNKYPQHYKDISFIFNDVDTIPFHKIFDYDTTHGVVKHYYGFKYALGGIVVMKGADFEKTNGFPGFWGWGMEDNVLQKRCEAIGLHIDRSVFYNIGSPEMLQLFDGISRIISKKDPWRGEHDNRMDGLITISELKYTIDEKSENPNDNIFVFHNPRIKVINISTFLTYIQFGSEEYYNYDLREPKRKIIHPDKIRETKKTVVSTNDWTNIPYYPTTLEKKENVVKYLISMGKQVPQSLLQEIANAKKQEIEQDAYNNIGNTSLNSDKSSDTNRSEHINNQQIYQSYSQNGHLSRIPTQMANPQQYYRQQPPPHKYSPEYAAYIGAKSRAQASARIRLGGAY